MEIKRVSKAEIEVVDETPTGYFDTGNVMLNIACTGKYNQGFGWGKVTNLIGDSFVGKTLQVKTIFAQLAHDPAYDEYRLIDDEVERGDGMDIRNMFGSKTLKRVEPPRYNSEGEPQSSDTAEEFLDTIYKLLKEGRPFLYALDTYDALTDKEEKKIVEENIKKRDKAREKGADDEKVKEAKSYGTMKTREFNKALRLIKSELQNTHSGLIVVSQVRENIGAGQFEPKLKRNGGKALKHYSWHEIWLAKIESIKRTVQKRQRVTGAWVQAKLTKNRTTGKYRTVDFPILVDYGVDNFEACIDFLTTENFWAKKGDKIDATELKMETSKQELIQALDNNERLQKRLYLATEKAWGVIEESMKIDRNPKYPVEEEEVEE